ncbi:MAG: HlyD family efflux transporter periplasmic adaptor subunit, partial [Oscillospiraceae bacterium]|nr:HlyD family efflux transporter periplasmic adaptor subunit [Oscillospiraceae bacterium]
NIGTIFSQPAYIGSIQSKVSGSGNARASQSAAITLTQSGTVEEVFVTSGQTVMAGEPLYTIFSQPARDAVAAAQEQIDRLSEELGDLMEEAGNLTVRAPFAGKLIEVQNFSVDQQVSRGTPVANLVNDKQLKLSLYFSYAYENDIEVGQSVEVSIPAVMRSFTGRVERINKVSFISPEGGVHFEVVVVFDNPGTLTADMKASAVLTDAEGMSIYPYSDGKTEYYEIRAITAKAAGPVTGVGTLLNYANVSEGDALLYLGSETIDDQIRAKRAEMEEAQEKLGEAVKALNDFSAVAPIDGTITSCTLSEGAEVKGGDTVIIISNTTNMLVNITVDDRNISFVKPGNTVELDWNGNSYMGTVTAIDMGGAQAGQGMTNYPVTLSVENWDGSLMDGAWLQYSFVTSQSQDCVLVPTSSVQYFSDRDGNRQSVVFVMRDVRPDDVPELDLPMVEPGQTRRFPTEEDGYYPVIVTTGISDTQVVEITSGVEAGDEVFVNYMVTDSGGSW